MTLDELTYKAVHAWHSSDGTGNSAMRVAVLAVLDQVRLTVPDARPGEHYLYRAGWDECRAAMIQRLDEMSRD